jgi:hypothetical protein
MQSTAILCVALLFCATAAGTPAPEDSAASKDSGGGPAFSDLERKGKTAADQVSPPTNARASGRIDTQRRRDKDMDGDHGTGELDRQFAPEGIKPK